MECAWDAALLRCGEELPPELLQIIQHGTNSQYLNAMTKASLDPRYTYLLFAHCEDLFANICATLGAHGSLPAIVATLGRIVPFAPFLMPYVEHVLADEYIFGSSKDETEDLLYLLGLFRLFSFERRGLRKFVRPTKIAPLLESSSRPVVYLAIRILQLYYHGADNWFEEMVKRYLGEDNPDSDINGVWDDRTIDYRFLTLWEEDRCRRFIRLIDDVKYTPHNPDPKRSRLLNTSSLDESTALVGGILLPRFASGVIDSRNTTFQLIQTRTISKNLTEIASALKATKPLFIEGLAGSGKTLLVRHVAQALGKLDTMITLHLNQQSDAKLLMGVYTTGSTPGSFVWKPGVLTTAVREGRWVLIEDLERAPDEIIGTLLPLIEKGELMIPSRKETIYAAPGFRILATARTSINHRGQAISPIVEILGIRHWQRVAIEMMPTEELQQVTSQLYPTLSPLLPQLHTLYDRLRASLQSAASARHARVGTPRTLSPRDLLKWSERVANLLQNRTTLTSNDMDDIFLEAMDCFAGALPGDQVRGDIAGLIAEELRIDPRRRDYLITQRDVSYAADESRLKVGRYELPRSSESRRLNNTQGSFSTNPHTNRMLEKVAGATTNREPLLLVGETGVGKTAAVQHLATHLGKTLVPFNLSQQSEAGDLLGGFKPVSARSIFVPMKDEFDDLFAESFSLSKNQQFLELLGKQTSRSNWKAVCKLWQQALRMVDQQRATSGSRTGEGPSKKRKVESKKAIDFARWDVFAAKVIDMERRIASGNDALAFSFVEGNIVKALRNGDWILLDEINLASSDTLESIADLLDPKAPSLLLSESGSIERIEAHPAFRVFAAMNPATDVGKKDLPPGIRSRFTELYVDSPDNDIKSLSSIVQSYLRHEIANDKATSEDVSKLYQSILELTSQNKLVDGAGAKPHFSLRTLTRTLSYATYIAPFCSLRRALYEGFQMSFLTLLDAESAKLIQPLLEQSLFGKRTNLRAELQKALRRPSEHHVQGYPSSKHWLQSGQFDIEEQPHYILTPFIRNNLENLVRATSTRQFPVLIQGPTSSGKTSMIEYLAKRTGHKFVRINNHEHTDLQEYLGTYISGVDGRLQFQDGVLVKALREGHWLVLDELNLAPSDILEALNRLLDDNRELLVPETQEVVRPHENFMLFATQNPAGLYGGRKMLSRAFRNRFLELHFDDIPIDELQEILHRRTQLPDSRCKRIVGVYRELSVLRQETRLFELKSFATLRDLFRWAQRPNDTMEQLATNGFMLLSERVRKEEERQLLKATIERVMGDKALDSNGRRVQINENELYAPDCQEVVHYDRIVRDQCVVWTKAMRRLYVLVARALANNEPVLLVGETGCGKTTVCQMLADAFGQKLHSVNAHQNTEAGDLIGSQRPLRNRAVIEANLRHQLLSSELLHNLDNADDQSTDALLDTYDNAIASLAHEAKSTYSRTAQHSAIQNERARFKALFEWVDGSLVQAMKEGSFFLLDEISLADDSVLERINSVLESQRSILLAEKGSIDSCVTASPGFQFLTTMNPGGDYGKRELSPALRNRFTEIWVPPLNDTEDVMQILQAKLIPAGVGFVKAMVGFAQWFKDRYNTSATSSISIRDALSWASFVNACSSSVGVESAVIHGGAMVYIDTLGANPAGLIAMSTLNIDQERKACIDRLSGLLQRDALYVSSGDPLLQVTDNAFTINGFSLPKQSTTPNKTTFSFDPMTTKTNALRVVRALQLPKPIMLEGNPGVGKTALITAIAEAVGIPLTRINLSEQTDLIDLFGSDVPLEGAEAGNFAWRDAPFLRAMKNGEWVLLDEMNLASQSVLEGLNACLDHRGEVFVPELGQTFSRHPHFKLFAAQNPHHQGGGRKGLPASFVNRFTVVYADAFKPDDLKLISLRSFPNVDQSTIETVIAFVHELDQATCQEKRIGGKGAPWEFNYRDISRFLTLATSDQALLKAGSTRDFADLLFLQRFRSTTDKAFVDNLFRRNFEDDVRTSDLFSSCSATHLQLGLSLLSRSSVVSNLNALKSTILDRDSNLKALQSVMLCVQHNWPVILTGRTGVGKSRLIERLAAVIGMEVATIAINAETDAMDLIGGFEQTDSRWQAEQTQHCSRDQTNLDALNGLKAQPVVSEYLRKISQELEYRGDADAVSTKPKFEWIDGILIDALREGKWLILDNANLCSPSVLDRLNSLLELNGVLIVNERNNADGSPQIITPHPNFRIFLTVNPRYGELSRAMRNRAVELYLPEPDLCVAMNCLDALFSESSMTRFRALRTLGDLEPGNRDLDHLSRTALDHLSFIDEPLLGRLITQISAGLYGLPEVVRLSLTLVLQARPQPYYDFVQSSLQLHKAALSQTQVPADFAHAQTFHPLNNQALIQSCEQTRTHAPSFAFVYDHCTQNRPLSELLQTVRSTKALVARVAPVERSLGWLNARTSVDQSSAFGLFDSMNTLLSHLSHWVRLLLEEPQTDLTQIKATINSITAIGTILMHLLMEDRLEPTILNSLMAMGRRVAAAHVATFNDSSGYSLRPIQKCFESFLRVTGYDSNIACVALWQTLKPATASNQDQFDAVMRLDGIIERFDHMCRLFVLPLDQVVDLRVSFVRSLGLAARTGYLISDLAASLEDAMSGEVGSITDLEAGQIPHFRRVFRQLSQHVNTLALGGNVVPAKERATIEIYAQLGVKKSQVNDPGTSKLFSLSPAIISSMPSHMEDHTQDGIGFSLIRQLQTTDQVPISRLDLLENEIRALGHVVSSQAHLLVDRSCDSLDLCLNDLVRDVLSAFQDHDVLRHTARDLARQLDPDRTFESLSDSTARSRNTLQDVDLENANGLARLAGVIDYLRANWGDDFARLKEAARAWARFASTCLHLYVPRGAFDPAVEGQARLLVYMWQYTDLNARLRALQDLRKQLTGTPDTLRATLLQKDIEALGPAPTIDNVYRPQNSQLSELQLEFDGLRRILQPLWNATEDFAAVLPLDSTFVSNLAKVKQRLSAQYRTYEDLTAPIVGFIDSMFVAHRLALMAKTREKSVTKNGGLARVLPFVEASLESWTDDKDFIDVNSSLRGREDVIYWLSTIATRSSATAGSFHDQVLLDAINQRFGQFYQQWKAELDEDRRNTAEKSSLYKYRYQEIDSDEVTQDELDELFRTGLIAEGDATQTPPMVHARQDAHDIARLHRQIFGSDRTKDLTFQKLLIHCGSGAADIGHHVGNGEITPTLILLLRDMKAKLDGSGSKAYNIYTDPNVEQTKKLLALLKRLSHRFHHLQSTWPDHATPVEVLRQCDEILEVPHSSPLPNYLPRLEKLYAAVNDWQSIASREFSVNELLTNVSDLIISWRQLELSTWAALFDREWKQCQKTAASWWYIAYETIVAATEHVDPTSAELSNHAKDLLGVLADFMKSSGYGEYSARLQILRGFEAHLAANAARSSTQEHVRTALLNLNSFYGHFEDTVAARLSEGRQKLEKEVKNVIQLASWKDRNIDVLRQSALSSHRKLLRHIRKFRNLLGQPALPVINEGLRGSFNEISISSKAVNTFDEQRGTTSTNVTSKLNIWHERPARFRSPYQTGHLINSKFDRLRDTLDATKKLKTFVDEVGEQISELQRSTPSFSTEENQALIQHLKTRKRRLLADVLKSVRKMGYQSAVSEQVLHQQESISAVLASLPAIRKSNHLPVSTSAEYELHRLLCIMPTVRESSRKHSDELTSAEVSRCLALLENILQTSITSHRSLSAYLEDFKELNEVLRQFKAVAMGDGGQVSRVEPNTPSKHYIQNGAACLQQAVHASVEILHAQADLSNVNLSRPIDVLKETVVKLGTLLERTNSLAELPDGLQKEEFYVLSAQYNSINHELRANIESFAVQHPETRPIVSQLLKWTLAQVPSNETLLINGHHTPDLTAWVRELFTTIDSMLSSIQDIEKLVGNDGTANDGPWLTRQFLLLNSILSALRMQGVGKRIAMILSQLQHLDATHSTPLTEATAVLHALNPIVESYQQSIKDLLQLHCNLCARTCNTGFTLATSFISLAQRGFCKPSEKNKEESKESGDVEAGTGLGDGEGAEDISKDVGDEEDLSELAQDGKREKDQSNMEQEKDAVDMADEELAGEVEDIDETEEMDEEASSGNGDDKSDVDEEAGDGTLDTDAIDEKMWDGGTECKESEKETDSGKGITKNEEMTAAEEHMDENEESKGDDEAETVTQKEEEASKQDEKLDPHAQEGSNLDLPDDIDQDDESLNGEDSDLASLSDDGKEATDAKLDSPEETESVGKKDGNDESEGEQEDGDETMEGVEETNSDMQEEGLPTSPQLQVQDDTGPDDEGHGGTFGEENKESAMGADAANTAQTEHPQNQDEENIGNDNEQQSTGASGNDSKQNAADALNADEPDQNSDTLPFRKLGDVLDQWYNKHREISSARTRNDQQDEQSVPASMEGVEFEHLPDESAAADAQAIGGASAEQSVALNESNAIEDDESASVASEHDNRRESRQNDHREPDMQDDRMQLESNDATVETQQPTAFVGEERRIEDQEDPSIDPLDDSESDDIDDVGEQMTNAHISLDETSELSFEDAQKLWVKHEDSTRNLALILTEHLRLILHPTQATKMRGDFRTGKRLNIKRIIPYIASSYKRDKIWMRRSTPTKRSYQIMLAIDDSKSMAESQSYELAFETLALIAKSMSMLEVGELGVVGFGEDVKIAHDFSTPFTSEAGARAFQHFTFAQTKTNVKQLLTESIALFRTARLRASGSASDLWQLQLIISDGICDDHPSIRQLVREAHEERIMIVFIVVDFATQQSSGTGSSKQSIIDMPTAQFVQDDAGNTQLKMMKYLDTFPFRYYLIVQNVQELPTVLAGALRQWLAEVVESGV